MFRRAFVLFIGMVFSVNCFAQDVFILPPGEVTPSQKRENDKLSKDVNKNKLKQSGIKSSQSATGYLDINEYSDKSIIEAKDSEYEDMKYYFQEHEWISISISFSDYFEPGTAQKFVTDPNGTYLIFLRCPYCMIFFLARSLGTVSSE